MPYFKEQFNCLNIVHVVEVVVVSFLGWIVHKLINTLSTSFVDKVGRCQKLVVFLVPVKSEWSELSDTIGSYR